MPTQNKRTATLERNTNETKIKVELNIDGDGAYDIDTGCGFLDHMLELFARHGRFDISLRCKGDVHVDDHHTAEDVAIALSRAFDMALGDRAGIYRYGSFTLPMDEALLLSAVDISGRSALGYALNLTAQKVGNFDTELVKEFFAAFARGINGSVHVRTITGENNHHIIEGAFKAFARALAQAVAIDEAHKTQIPSTKGTIL